MSSTIQKGRRAPQQARATRRFTELLEAGAAVVAEHGYEGATMTAVAQRAACSIGALYQYFKNKEEIAHALRVAYGDEMALRWDGLIGQAGNLTVAQLVEAMFDLMLAFIAERPAYLPLLAAPSAYRRDPAARQRLRAHFAAALRGMQPALPEEEAVRLAHIVLQLVKSLNPLYAEAAPGERPRLVAEFKDLVTLYLRNRLEALN
jgi:AcrR family transcriptional regulator